MITDKWTQEELDYLYENYANTCSKELAKHCKKPQKKLSDKARTMGLRKSTNFISELRGIEGDTKSSSYKKYIDMLEFGNSLDPSVKHRNLTPIFNKYGFYKFKELYKLHSV